MNRLLKYGCALFLFLGYSQVFAFADNTDNTSTISSAESFSVNTYHREGHKAITIEIVYVEERIETEDNKFTPDDLLSQCQSLAFAFQAQLLHHASNGKFLSNICQSPAALRSPYLVLRVFRI